MFRSTITTLLLLATAVSAPGADTHEDGVLEAQTTRLTILHTSDLHGAVLPYDDIRGGTTSSSLAQVATLVRSIRAEVEHPVLLLDSGDTIQGTALELFCNVRWGRRSPTIEAMNRIGYQAMAVGNHEFNFGLEVLRQAEKDATFPFLSANTVNETDGRPAFSPYRLFDFGELRVGVLGLTTPNIPGWETADHYRGLRFEPMHEAARRWVDVLRTEHGCDLVVVLAHTGFERHQDTGVDQGTAHEDFAWRLTRVPGIDVMLTGHTHQEIAPREVAGAIISQPHSSARFLTRIDLDLVAETSTWKVSGWHGENISTTGVTADPAIMRAFADDRQEVVQALAATLTHLTGAVSVERCRLEDCAALDLIHAVQLEATGADLSLAAILSDRTPALAPGPLSWNWVHALYIFPNTLMKVRVSGQQVKDILEQAARFYDGLHCPADGPCTVRTDPEISHYNVDTMAGVSYRIDPTRPEGDRVRDLRRNGRELDLHEHFTLAVNNYRAAGGGAFPHLADAEVLWSSATEIAELIGTYLEKCDQWHPTVDSNWRIAPDPEAENPLSERP